MGRLHDAMTNGRPALDLGWRVALYPAGTSLVDALAAEAVLQGEHGRAIVPGTGRHLTAAERSRQDHRWRPKATATRAVQVLYRVTGPGIHA